MAKRNVDVNVKLNTKKAKGQARKFGNFFSQLLRASASAANSRRTSLGARQIGGGLGSTIVGTALSPVTGAAGAFAFGALNRGGERLARAAGLGNFLDKATANNRAFNNLRSLAENTAVATGGKIDQKFFGDAFAFEKKIETLKNKGAGELGLIASREDVNDLQSFAKELKDPLNKLVDFVQKIVDKLPG